MIDINVKKDIVSKVMRLSSDILEDLEYSDGDYSSDVYGEVAEMARAEWYGWGRSKLVLSFDDVDGYVVKIPIRKFVDDYGNTYRYKSAVLCEDDGKSAVNSSDYCRIEAEEYEIACASGVGDMFAGTWKLCDVDGMPVYVSEKIDKTFDELESIKDLGVEVHEWKWIKEQCRENGIYTNMFTDSEVLDVLIQKYDLEKIADLTMFLSKQGIVDLHLGNIGVDKNGDIKIIDYPGFFD